ncbi:hypothetical protein ACIODT_05405 [Streptomyces sp. NPDC088251]|uniref:hypothetical protein n=1 Tax=unclassified Streptomyces TaxID=2593676 RepID=UPI0037F7719C
MVLHRDLPQGLETRAVRAACPALAQVLQHPDGVSPARPAQFREGTCSPERGRRDNGHLNNYIDLQNGPEHAR